MIDVALTPDGSVVLMAHGDAAGDDVRVRLSGHAVEIVEPSGRVVARTEAMEDRPLSRLAAVKIADVLLAGKSGLKGFAANVVMGVA